MAESDRSLNTSMYSPGENTRAMGILEEKICAFLERKGAGAQLKALEIAKGVGLTKAKDVNKALYNLQGKGCLQKGGDTSPLWSLAGSSVSAGVNYLPNPTGTPSKHGIKEILKSRTGVKELPNPTGTPSNHGMKEILKSRTGAGGEGVRAKELARDLGQPKSAVNSQLYAMLSRGEVKVSRTSEGGSSFWKSADEYGSSNSKKEGKDAPDSMPSTVDECSDSDSLTSHSAASRFREEFSSVKVLGQGGFGCIYLAKGKLDETDYAIKVVEFDMHASREVKALALFQHPNIVRYYAAWKEANPPQSIEIVGSSDWGYKSESKDISTESNTPMMYLYIQMEFCGMGTLTQWIAKRNNGVIRSKEEALNVFEKIVDGVKYVHSRQHIHRDLKPDNILFGSNGTVKIGDFGLVTKITSGNGASIERTMGTGTWSYMSPEQKNESKYYDEKVDIFPLGLIFFEVLWRIGSGIERAKLWEGLRRGELPEEFRKEYKTEHVLICKMLSEAPENRPRAEDIAMHLRLLLNMYLPSWFREAFSSIKKLGQGGCGSIYLAKGNVDETDYAIKVVEFDMHASREVKALALFQHPNIVRYHAAWKEANPPQSIEIVGSTDVESKDIPPKSKSTDVEYESESKDISTKAKSTPMMYLYIQMEFCGMGTLTQWIAKRNDGVIRSKEEALNVFEKIVDGVKYVHSRQHIHRDLKPDNILFGSDGTVKIGDFGLVTKITSGNGASIERTMGTGTPPYMSPEQKNESTYDEKVDIFPLGLIFFEVLWRIGSGMERAKLLEGLKRGEFPEEFRKEYTTEHVLIRKMLSEAPENRPRAEDIAMHLRLLLEEKTFLSPKNITV